MNTQTDDKTITEFVLVSIISDSIKGCDFCKDINKNFITSVVRNKVKTQMEEKKVKAFKPNTNIAITLNSANLKSVKTQEEMDEVLNKSDSLFVKKTFNSIVSGFTLGLNSVLGELLDVNTLVSELENQYNLVYKRIKKDSEEHPYNSFGLSYERWESMDILGPENQVINEINGDREGEINLKKLSLYSNKIDIMQMEKERQVAFKIGKEGKETLIKELADITSINEKELTDLTEYLFNERRRCSAMGLVGNVCKFGRIADNVESSKEAIKTVAKFIDGWYKLDKSTRPDSESITKNLEILQHGIKALIYSLCHIRYNVWNSWLILPTGKINNDNMDEAVSNGLTKDDIRLFMYYNKDTMSMKTIQMVKNKKDTYSKILSQELIKQNHSNSCKEKDCKIQAMSFVIENYKKNNPDCKLQSDLSKAIARAFMTDEVQDVKPCIFDILLKAKTGLRPITKQIYDKISTNYVHIESEEISERAKNNATISGLAESVLEKIFEKYMY